MLVYVPLVCLVPADAKRVLEPLEMEFRKL